MSIVSRVTVIRPSCRWLGIVLLILTTSATPAIAQLSPTPAAQVPNAPRLVRLMAADRLNLVDPTAMLYLPTTQHFLVATQGTQSNAPTLVSLSPYEDRLAATDMPADLADTLLAYDQANGQLLLVRRATGQITSVQLHPNGLPDWRTRRELTARLPGAPSGLAVAGNGTFFVLSHSGGQGAPTLEQLTPMPADAQATPATAAPTAFAHTTIALALPVAQEFRSLALHPQSGQLFTLDPAAQRLYAFTPLGQLVANYDLAPFGLRTLQGIAFAPSGDQTDEPATIHLYLVERGATATSQPNGRIAEFSFTPSRAAALGGAGDVATLVRTVETSAFSPPSPDPSGVAYIPATAHLQINDVLLLSDAEVEEMDVYEGANIFQTNRAGVLQRTYTTSPDITREPAGMAFNPHDGHLFLTDDDNIRPLIEIVPGPDQTYLTADDTFTKVSLRDSPNYGNNDPEGVEYARVNGVDTLFIVDGLNSELYVAQPGPNGKFDGTDDIVVHYDTKALGIEDPEGITYHPQTGTLYLVGNPNTRVAELTTTGQLIRYIDISAANTDKPAGLTFAPGSNNPNAQHLYLVARGVDNDSDSSENDGRLYEFAIPSGGNRPPVVTVGAAQTINWPNAATLSGTVTDDGLPAPANLTTTWSKVSGPGEVTFAAAADANTTATFSQPGAYELQLTASDGELTGSATVVITVVAVNQPPVITIHAAPVVELAASLTLTATITDDGLPTAPGTVTVAWQQLSGPGTVSFSDAASPVTAATFDAVGAYHLAATANDGELTSSASVTITVAPSNLPPTVDAGPDQLIGFGDSTQLSATVSDDNLPNPPGTLTLAWNKVAGPGAVTFTDGSAATTTVAFTARGTYRLALTATDGKATTGDELTITVGAPNQAPSVDAGLNQQVASNAVIALLGSVADDGIPNPPGAVNLQWSKLTGPGTVTFANASAAVTTATVDQAGIYLLQLAADDGRRQTTDQVLINVGVANEPPALVLGTGATVITTTVALSLSVTASDEWIPAPTGALSYAWTVVSGPSMPTIVTPTASTTTLRFTQAGEYLIRITVSDGELSSMADFTITINAPNFPPQVQVSAPLLLHAPGTVELSAVVTDDGQPEPAQPLTYQWAMSAGPAPVSFTTPTALRTLVEFPQIGLYTVTLRVSDGALEGVDTVVIAVGIGNLFSNHLPVIQTGQ